MSYTRLRMSAMVSSSSLDMLNLAKSGLKVTQVQFSEALHAPILGSPFWLILSVNTCTNRCKHSLVATLRCLTAAQVCVLLAQQGEYDKCCALPRQQ